MRDEFKNLQVNLKQFLKYMLFLKTNYESNIIILTKKSKILNEYKQKIQQNEKECQKMLECVEKSEKQCYDYNTNLEKQRKILESLTIKSIILTYLLY